MKMRVRTMSFLGARVIFIIMAVFLMCSTGWTQTHDLVMQNAPDYTSADPADWKSPDIKIGSDFGETFPANIVRRGVANPIFARFYINGTHDYEIPSAPPADSAVKISFYWREATVGTPPPDIDASGWNHIDDLPVTYDEAASEDLYLTLTWPDNFPSVTTKSVEWTPPTNVNYFYVAAKVVYPVGITDVNEDDNVAISLYESILGLRDVDVVLVVDASGSMQSFTYMGMPYIEHAKDKAGLFVYSMTDTGAHEAAVVSFSTSYYPDYYKDIWETPPTSPYILEPVTDANKGDIVTAINNEISAGGATPMGAGLQRAIDILTEKPLDPTRKRAILLLSDGYDNSGTPRACPYTGTCADEAILSQLQDNNIRVFSVALGESAWEECLECLAENSGGHWYGSVDLGIDLAEVLLEMQQAYTEDDLYRIDRGVTGGGVNAYSTYFEGKDNVLYFILAWDVLGDSLGLELRPPGSRAWINPERSRLFKANKGKGYLVVRVKNPKKGAWGYRVTGDTGKNYLVAVRSDRVGVRLGMDVSSSGTVGYPLEITARLMDGKKPVKTQGITATVQVPVVSINTLLQKTSRAHMLKYKTLPVDPRVLQKNPDLSLRNVYINKLKGKEHKPLVKTRTVKVPLEYIGKGIYKGVLKSNYTTTAGKYNVTVTCNEKSFNRNFSRQLLLKPGPVDSKRSFFDVLTVKSNTEQSWLLCVYPTDRFGNAVTCSSLAKGIKATFEQGKSIRTPEVVFGAFQQKLSVLPGKEPKLKKVTVNGKLLKKAGGSQ